ncbi:hypothetical protein EV192_101979 [Actinocrispum wychmicini]|uniref:Membrane protein YfhO n=1 Tax=Actinocrispum wychmicini TaxID=1213861 RepID=A0A4R2JXA8_9PSEU|nr:hypothetical protein EV192_101979 [Actinocrispum wychmicini]
MPPLAVCVLVGLLAQIPALRQGLFYMVDDSAAQFLPMWRRIGEQLLNGTLPLLDVDSWAGGNLAGEALFGLWNPVNLFDYVLVTRFDDLATAATVVKTQFLVIAALGVYLLIREYGGAKWAAFSLAVALPFSGFILYFQAGTWAGGLMTFAWVPFMWWSARRAARRAGHPIWAFVFGGLCVTAGNPYGVLVILVVYIGLYVEFRQWRVVLIGLSVAAIAPLVFLPLVGAASVGGRNGMQFFNNGELAPGVTDLLTLSVPSQLPSIKGFDPGSIRLRVPATYFAWFAVPVLAWLDWGVLRRRRRELTAVFVVTGTYLVFCLAPSHLWMFRWPLRNIENLYLGLAVLLGVLMTAGLRTDHFRRRVLITAGALLGGTYLAVASWPKISARHLLALALVALLTTLLIMAVRRGNSRWQALVLTVGTAVVLVLQTTWAPLNTSVTTAYPTPPVHRSSYMGTVAQVAVVGDATGPPARGVLFGNGYAAAGVPSLMAYTGIDYSKFTKALCQDHRGTCHEGYDKLFAPVQDNLSIADLARVQTVVVERRLVDDPKPRPGWRVLSRDNDVTVLRREGPIEFPFGRISALTAGVTVDKDTMDGARSEQVRFRRGQGPAQVTFARLAWPGYRAEVNGRKVPVREDQAGFLVVDLPEGVDSGELKLGWTPPGFVAGIVCALLGLALAVALGWPRAKRPRSPGALLRRRRESPHRTEPGRDHQVVAG